MTEEKSFTLSDALCVLEFSKDAQEETRSWLLEKLQLPRYQGGGQLKVKTIVNKEEAVIVFLSADTDRLLQCAELMELKKVYNDGSLREFTMQDVNNFKYSGDVSTLLLMSEKQRCISYILDNLRALSTDESVPGCEKKLHTGESIIDYCVRRGIIIEMFPLHDREERKSLSKEWIRKLWQPQPLDRIRNYFGESIAIYFAFLSFYTWALLPPSILGLLYYVIPLEKATKNIIFAAFNLIWSTLILEGWKRKGGETAYKWGTLDMAKFEEARGNYYGVMGTNDITGRPEPKYPKWKRSLKFYAVSLPLIILLLQFAFVLMVWYFWLEQLAIDYWTENPSVMTEIVTYLPSIVYGILIAVMNLLYRILAKALNDWENHRLQSAYESHFVLKLVLFDFINSFVSLFYIAFWLQDMEMLKTTLFGLLIAQQILNQFIETLLPYLMRYFRVKKIKKEEKDGDTSSEDEDKILARQARLESAMEVFEGMHDDYLEMFLQFGYVFLFSSVFPLAALCALINNITEIRTDAFRFCHVYRRPVSVSADTIGAWQLAFEAIVGIGVMTNTAVIAMSPKVQGNMPVMSDTSFCLVFIAAEHFIFCLKLGLQYLIPDTPRWVKTAIAKKEWDSKQALIRQRHLETAESKKDL